MTLIAGFLCPDGFVISADTEIGQNYIRYQSTKVVECFRKGTSPEFWLVMGGSGNGDYLDQLMQEIADEAEALIDPTIINVHAVIHRTVERMHDATLIPMWRAVPAEREDHRVSLMIGLREPSGQVAMWRTLDKSISRIPRNQSGYVGSGDSIGHYVGNMIFQPGMPLAVTHHIATQIIKEARAKGANVGGNIDTCSVRGNLAGYPPYFSTPDNPDIYLWGLVDTLNSAVRCALNGRVDAMRQRIDLISNTLHGLESASRTPLSSQDTEWHTLHIGAAHTDPFADF